MSDENETVRVQLARMEGKLDLSNLRHDQNEARITELSNRVHGHANRLQTIEARELMRSGEEQGLSKAGRVAWAAIGLIPGGGIVALLMKLFGA